MKPNSRGNGAAIRWLIEHKDYAGEGCLIWPFSRKRGYGQFVHEGENHYAHRYMCKLVNGPPPTDQHQSAHSCGRGEDACVHPLHVFWKTPSENQLDKRIHGTTNANGGRLKLTPEDVARIRSLKGQVTQDQMAKMFGVSRRNIGAVLQRRSWPTGELPKRGFAVTPYRKPAFR